MRIIIVGGGFGGVQCARTLRRILRPQEPEIVLFDRENHLVFSPLLAEVVGSSLNALDIIVPHRQLLPGVYCQAEEVAEVLPDRNSILFVTETGSRARMGYDHLVLACGGETNLNAIPGMADHGFPLKTLADATTLRAHVIGAMEQAEVSTPERRSWHLTFLVVGGGYSGVEAAGEINDLVRASAKYYRNWTGADVRVILIHSRDHILPEIGPKLRSFAQARMRQAGVEFLLNARVELATPEGVGLGDGRFLPGGTIVCTVGSSPSGLVEKLPAEKHKGRLLTDPDLRLKGRRNIWAIGDCAWIVNGQRGEPCPPTGQFAERQGKQCALNIARCTRDHPTRPFAFRQLGELSSIGGHSAVADLLGWQLSGFLAWFVWRGVYLFKLPTIGRKLQVGFDWAFLLVFPRDLAHMRSRQTDRVTHAHYGAGDTIFRQGDAPVNFYVLERGEVEILRANDGSPPEVVALLGPGSFFGEQALMSDRPRSMSVRARTAVDVLVMGKHVFTRISGALAPMKEALAQTLNRRAVDPWHGQPEVQRLLRETPVSDLAEPAPRPLLRPGQTLRDAAQAFVDTGHEFLLVSDDGRVLDGIVTLTDLLRARSVRPNLSVRELMTPNPVAVSAGDHCAVAFNALREYRLKTLPVVNDDRNRSIQGILRARRLMAYVLQATGQAPEKTDDP